MAPIVISGSIAQRAGYGGHAWALLQYLLGLRSLGYQPLLIDRLTDEMVTDRLGRRSPARRRACIRWLSDVMRRAGLERHYALLLDDGLETVGVSRREVLTRVAQSAAVINVMGFLNDEEILGAARRRVFLDIDPGFTQMWRELGQHDSLRGHDDFVTVAENIGLNGCKIPTCGVRWITTPQPVVLDCWPPHPGGAAFTAIGAWRGPYDAVEYRGTRYGLRAHEFRRFATLPRLVEEQFELALDIDPADAGDAELLRDNGWRLVQPRRVAADPWGYRAYIQRSKAEFMVAKGMYVQTWSGWFSDRSICYLASGKPVIAQDTGFTRKYPAGRGLLSFTTLEQAADAVDEISQDYDAHSAAARAFAEEYFDSRSVIPRLLADLDLA